MCQRAPKRVRRRKFDAGITLIEIMVSMAIFGLIGSAGFAMLDQTLRSRSKTEGRLERLGEMQRTMYLINLDLLQTQGHSFVVGRDTQSELFTLRRTADAYTGGNLETRYVVRDGTLIRELGQPPNELAQTLLTGIAAAHVRFVAVDEAEWRDVWPPMPAPQGAISANPKAVEVTLDLLPEFAGTEASLRRVVILPDGMP